MIDTVVINHRLTRPPDEEQLRSLGWHPRYNVRDGTIKAYLCNEPKGSSEPRLTCWLSPKMEWHLKAEASLPKLLRGSNIPLLDESEIERSLQLFSTSVERRSGYRFNLNNSLVSKVDFARDIRVGESEVVQMIVRLFQRQIPRYDRELYNDTSAVFTPKGESKSKRILVYNKQAEVIQRGGSEEERRNALGIIRVEISLKTPSINYLTEVEQLNVPSREVQHILTRNVADYVFQNTLKKLRFGAIDPNSDEAVKKLHAHFGTCRMKTLLGFLELRKRYGEDFYKHEWLDVSRSSYFRDLADCRHAGVLPYE
jgi:hypothetical protein